MSNDCVPAEQRFPSQGGHEALYRTTRVWPQALSRGGESSVPKEASEGVGGTELGSAPESLPLSARQEVSEALP